MQAPLERMVALEPAWANASGLGLHMMELTTHCGEGGVGFKANVQGPEHSPYLKSSKTAFVHTHSSWHTPFKTSCDRGCIAMLLPSEK